MPPASHASATPDAYFYSNFARFSGIPYGSWWINTSAFGKARSTSRITCIRDCVRIDEGEIAVQLQMKLDERLRAGRARAQIVDADDRRVRRRDGS